MKQVKEIMTTSAVSCNRDETIKNVTNQMSKANIGFVPVVDENKKVVGTITDRDVALFLASATKTPDKIKAEDVMSEEVHTIRLEDDASKALEVMRTKQIGRLPVVDSEERLQGVVSLMGIARKIKDSSDKSELENQGKENIMNTVYAIAERNHNTIEELA